MIIQNKFSDRKIKSLIGDYAGFASRLIAFVLDVVIISIVLIFSTWFLSATLEMLQIKLFLKAFLQSHSGLSSMVDLIFRPITASLFSFLFVIGYHVLFWHIVGQTPGKAVLGIRVVPIHGGKIAIWRAFLRYIGYFISGIALGLGFLWILIDDKRMGWHDRLAGTCVIYVWDAQPDETFLAQKIQELVARREKLAAFLTHRKKITEDK